MRKVIYTAITGDYDTLKEPAVITPGWEYICYTNNPNFKSNVWNIVSWPVNTVKEQRQLKIIPPADADVNIWIDGSIIINCNLDDFLQKYQSGDFTLMKHPDRNCVYQEAQACIQRNKDSEEVINKQIQHYKQLQYPTNRGMVATGILIRKNTSEVRDFCSKWWEQVSLFSKRDQLSFNFVAYSHSLQYHTIPFSILKNEFILTKHNHRK